MIRYLWQRLEPFVNALITRRILLFHEALISRGQIERALDKPPTVEVS